MTDNERERYIDHITSIKGGIDEMEGIAGKRRADYSGGLSEQKQAGAVELSELVLKQAYDIQAAAEAFYSELLGSAVASPLTGIEKGNPSRGGATGVIPQTKETLNEIAQVLNRLRHLISSASMGIK
jgi:hypothetical protein